MNILFIGDINGKPGRKIVKHLLPKLKKQHKVDLVIANTENIAHGTGITPKTLKEVMEAGIDICTSGNHVWDNDAVLEAFKDKEIKLIRPANYPARTPGKGEILTKVGKTEVVIINVQGNVFMNKNLACPFRTAEKIIRKYQKKGVKHFIVDHHAEATSEKIAMRYHLDGLATAVVGTHTHVMTADERVSEKGTASITDVGMCGPYESILGVEKDIILYKFLTQLPRRHEVPEGNIPVEFDAVLIETDNKTGKATKIKPIRKVLKSL